MKADDLEDESKPATVGVVIRELRTELGLTQVQFAAEVGITATSVYRYEAGTNFPTNDILRKILQFAVKKQALAAIQTLAQILAFRSGLTFREAKADADAPLDLAISQLRLDRQLQIMAAVLMLHEDSDETAVRMFGHLVQPWISKAQEAFGPLHVDIVAPGSALRPISPDKEKSKNRNEKC